MSVPDKDSYGANPSPRRVPTLKDVADRAKVHLVTASVVLSKSPAASRRVSEATRKRILQAAEDLQYQPSVLSRSFQNRNSSIVGYYHEWEDFNLDSLYFQRVLSGLKDACYLRNFDLLLHTFVPGEELDTAMVRNAFLGNKTCGLIVRSPGDTPLMRYLADSHLPVVAMTGYADYFPTVIVDDEMGSSMTAKFLHSRGIERIIFLQSHLQIADSTRRTAAMVETGASCGIEVLILNAPSKADECEELQAAIVDSRLKRTAIVAWYDDALVPVVDLCGRMGLHIPHDISIAGFDGFGPLINYPGTLTTIIADWRRVTFTAIDLLETIIAGEVPPQLTAIPVTLQIGDSCI